MGVRSKSAVKFFIKSPFRQKKGRVGFHHVFLFFGLGKPGDPKAWGLGGFPLGWGEGEVRRDARRAFRE